MRNLLQIKMIRRPVTYLNVAILWIVLLACICHAQETAQQVEPTRNQCDSNIGRALPATLFERALRQSGKVQLHLFPLASTPQNSKCDFLSLALPVGLKSLTRGTSDRVHSGIFSFDSRVAKSGAASAIHTNGALAQGAQAQEAPDNAANTQELAKKLANPVASLISFPIQSNFDFGMGAGSGWRYTLNVQPVIPITLSPNWNLISRTIIPIIHQGHVTGPNTSQSGLGDTLQSLFFSPDKAEPFIWAVGPVFLFPTATDSRLGAQKWGVGPTALVIKQENGWTYGVLANHIWSVAGKSNRGEVNATFVQPVLSYTTRDAWTYSINTESTYDWVSDSWSTPINPFISKLVRFGTQPISFGGGVRCWVTTPTGGPEGCGLRIAVTALFPKK